MAKRLELDSSWLEPFRELLSAGLVFGPLLSELVGLQAGKLRIWVPERYDAISERDLRRDVFFEEESWGDWEELCSFFSEFLNANERNVIIAPDVSEQMAWKAGVPWFTCGAPQRACFYVTPTEMSVERYSDFLNAAWCYPLTVLLTSFGERGREFDVDGLVDRVEHVVLGVYDRCAYMSWSRCAGS